MAAFGFELDRLVSDLQKPSAFGRFFMFVYPPHVERRMSAELPDLASRLQSLGRKLKVIDVNAIVNAVIAERLDDLQTAWINDQRSASEYVCQKAIPMLVNSTIEADKQGADVVAWSRVGGAYPFLSVASTSERLIGRVNAAFVVFYPGHLEGKTQFRLLGKRDGYQYRFESFYNVQVHEE